MKKILMLLVAVLFVAPVVQAQAKKKVAVYVTGEDVSQAYKKVIGAKMVTGITRSDNFVAIERTADFLNALSAEQDYQVSGAVKDSQIVRIGQQFGVRYVAVVDVSELFDELFVSARMIDVETGRIIRSFDASSPAEEMSQLIELSDKVSAGLTEQVVTSNVSDAAGQKKVGTAGIQTFTVNGVSFEMVSVEGGNYKMGADDSDAGNNEYPVHMETIADFMIGRTEVTQGLWQAVMGTNPSSFKGPVLPVENVSWNDCQEFLTRLNALTGQNFRLPTEAEWEYVARGGKKSRETTYSGNNDPVFVAWFAGNSNSTSRPVGGKTANELNIYDMSGNVWEWTADLYSDNYNFPRTGGSTGTSRVIRGGSWRDAASLCRVSNRSCSTPDGSSNDLGFRLAL